MRPSTVAEMFSDDDEGSQYGGTASGTLPRIRNVLTLEERVAVIRQYDIVPMYSRIAKTFNCSWEQIKSIVSNREPIMEFYEATRRNHKQPSSKCEELRRRKLNFLGHCLYEYIQRAQYYLHTDINEEMIRTKALEFRDLMHIDSFMPNKPWINHFKAAYNITLSNRQITMTRKPPRSLELRDIMSYCGRHTNQASNLAVKQAEPNAAPYPTSLIVGQDSTSSPPATQSPIPLHRIKTLAAASSQNQATLEEVQLRRKRKINFLQKCLYEYIQRSQIHQGRLDLDNLRTVAINLRDILKIENFFPDKMWFLRFKSHYNFNLSQGVPLTSTRRVPLSLDLRDIVSYCGRNEQRITLAHKIEQSPKTNTAASNFVHLPLMEPKSEDGEDHVFGDDDEDDDCVAIESPPELIEINDDEDEPSNKRKADEPMFNSSLKIQKIELHNNNNESSVELELASAPSPGHYSENSDEAELPRCVETYADALRLLKPLEEFALLEENYRAIGLLTQLEKIFENARQKKE